LDFANSAVDTIVCRTIRDKAGWNKMLFTTLYRNLMGCKQIELMLFSAYRNHLLPGRYACGEDEDNMFAKTSTGIIIIEREVAAVRVHFVAWAELKKKNYQDTEICTFFFYSGSFVMKIFFR
jgi:hypothetical protein